MTMAKQLTGAHFPLSRWPSRRRARDHRRPRDELGTLGHGFTYGGHRWGRRRA